MRPYDVVTFDCYGTMIDWERGIVEAFGAAAASAGAEIEEAVLLEAYHEVEAGVESERYRRYREVLMETAGRVAAHLGFTLPPAGPAFLPESLPSWPPFPDTNAALERLAAAGYRLGILSNVDDDLLAGTRRHLAPVFDPDLIVTAEQVRSYKPGPAHFEAAQRRIGERRWLHAAQSLFHDVAAAQTLGIPCAWVNRRREKPATPSGAVREVRTLAQLADWLCGSAPR